MSALNNADRRRGRRSELATVASAPEMELVVSGPRSTPPPLGVQPVGGGEGSDPGAARPAARGGSLSSFAVASGSAAGLRAADGKGERLPSVRDDARAPCELSSATRLLDGSVVVRSRRERPVGGKHS